MQQSTVKQYLLYSITNGNKTVWRLFQRFLLKIFRKSYCFIILLHIIGDETPRRRVVRGVSYQHVTTFCLTAVKFDSREGGDARIGVSHLL